MPVKPTQPFNSYLNFNLMNTLLPAGYQNLRKTPVQFVLLCFVAFLLLNSCATSHMSAVTNVKPQHPYVNLMVLFVKNAPEIIHLDEATYNTHLKNKFNNLNDIKMRQQLEKAFAGSIETQATLVTRSSDHFAVGTEVGYQTFLAKLKETGAEGVIIVNNNARWIRNNYTTYGANSDVSFTSNDPAPNAAFLCYLIDLNSNKPVWMSQTDVNGTSLDNNNTLANSLARKVGNNLKNEGYIYLKVSDLPITYTNTAPVN